MNHMPDGLCVSDARCLPIVAAYVKKLDIIETVNRLCPSDECDVSTGHMVAAMILDTLSGRRPLYLLETSFENLDIELLLGVPHDAGKLNPEFSKWSHFPESTCRDHVRTAARYCRNSWLSIWASCNTSQSLSCTRLRSVIFLTASVSLNSMMTS